MIASKILNKIRKIKHSFKRFLVKQLLEIRLQPDYHHLTKSKPHQKKIFETLAIKFSEHYKKIKTADDNTSAFIVPDWQNSVTGLEKSLLPKPPFNFLRHPIVQFTMFVTGQSKLFKHELEFLEKNLSQDQLKSALVEDPAGHPPLATTQYLTSPNSVHHLFHLANFVSKTGVKLDGISSIVEWGGGYGNLVKIFYRLYGPKTYIIIDLPIMACLQWLYLSTVLDVGVVNLISSPDDKIIENKINLIPLNLLDQFQINGELFISTWAISESSSYAHQYVNQRNFFNANHMLIAFHSNEESFPGAENIGAMAKARGALIEEIPFLSSSFYALK